MLEIAVLITCHNRKNKTIHCLKRLFAQSRLNQDFKIQVYLVDDGSTDGTSEAVRESFPKVKIINGSGQLYWNRGMHLAWKTASAKGYKFYLWLNDDTELYQTALRDLIADSNAASDSSIICGCIESPNKRGDLVYGGVRLRNNKHVVIYPNGNINECDIINGNCVLIPESVFNRIGNLDLRFSHAIGDHDYSLRAKSNGIRSFTSSHFIASCLQNESLPKWCLPKTSLIQRLKSLYSPLAYSNPPEYFVYEKRHFGLLVAVKHYLSIHIRVLIPGLWK